MPVGRRIRDHFRHRLVLGRQVAFRALVSFLVTFAILRGITYSIHHHDNYPFSLLPIRDMVTKTGLHIHHLFWGILLLMMVGWAALGSRDPRWHLRLAVVFGIALGLTLDEFALWLNLADVYWSPEGRESFKAVAVAAALLALVAVGRPFWVAVAEELWALIGRRGSPPPEPRSPTSPTGGAQPRDAGSPSP